MEFIEIISQYSVPMIVAICLIVGYIIKHAVPNLDNRFIPLIGGCLGLLLNIWIQGFAFSPEILLAGLASGLAATGGYEAVRNLISKK